MTVGQRVSAAAVLLLCVAATVGAPAASTRGDQPPATILFVCEHGVGRSTIAAAYFNRLAKEKGLPYRATFRGTDPDAALPPVVRDGLTRDGFDVSALTPARVTPEDLREAERIVVFGCLLPGRAAVEQKVIDVNGTPGPGDGYEQARDAIRTHVERLVEELARK
jgi:arsenate reductase (thioredoxin)